MRDFYGNLAQTISEILTEALVWENNQCDNLDIDELNMIADDVFYRKKMAQ